MILVCNAKVEKVVIRGATNVNPVPGGREGNSLDEPADWRWRLFTERQGPRLLRHIVGCMRMEPWVAASMCFPESSLASAFFAAQPSRKSHSSSAGNPLWAQCHVVDLRSERRRWAERSSRPGIRENWGKISRAD